MSTKKVERTEKGPVAREYTINLQKDLKKICIFRRAPRAIKLIKKFAQKNMKTNVVLIDDKLNKYIWAHGIKTTPNRVRVVLQRKRAESGEDETQKMITVASLVPDVASFKNLKTKVVTAN
ncbi:S60 ribosomal protein L31 [Cavenderia fasciculata]|uniref:S60 ribosomal protein L31 n=1 Tax=Cavenderia fasciculata TaxID=261658 RepID=F4Q1L9_CACFS|nr:S60 ribosomal protein L31 [Cavenderia fasciculata]EGG18720.1 S60 ribosomal protein L31 [Cavenderia fasciculata]|eukprot:XP_004366624.1 S60 ribosomal protein L31 [Cavenderia fasciculata]